MHMEDCGEDDSAATSSQNRGEGPVGAFTSFQALSPWPAVVALQRRVWPLCISSHAFALKGIRLFDTICVLRSFKEAVQQM